MIEIKEAISKKELKAFVKFPFKLYKNSKYWVPPIIREELKTFDKTINPVFNDADARFFLAYKNGELVGRIAAIINWLEVKDQSIKKMRFGWFDFIDDQEVSKALLDTVRDIGIEHQLEFIEGPVGFSNLDKVGVMTEGFDHIGTMITWYNYPYYLNHYESYGLKESKAYVESKFAYSDIKPETFTKIQDLIKRRYKLKALEFRTSDEIMAYADEMFDVFETSHAKLSSFVAINPEQKAYFKKKFLPFLNPEYVKFIVDKDDKLIGFAIVTPSYAEALQKMNGRLFPFGFRHIMHAKKHSKSVTFYLIGILPEYQNKGVTAIIFHEFYREFGKKNIEQCIRGPELADNDAIHKIWKHFNPKVHKRRCTMSKPIA
ncbi:MAG: GTP cyclohydrolase [Winogradskyella sp.]|uniref:GTP cyclohydrolase n=1 Tax=Winogradskyella sp. TaxID=1883156 RepID=UPI000F3DF6D2|nr:GTP cyclohydrolase [Winogradskyella sp.]RNC86314.1 MAG: GTP cyclohydrolase [Winogradskyella sp.]